MTPWSSSPRRAPRRSRACRLGSARPGRPAERLGDLVAGERRAAVSPELVVARRRDPRPGRQHRHDLGPHRSLGRPTTTASNTAGWALRTCSTSSANTFSPPVLIVTESRPSSSIVPSASTRARSPATAWRTPSTVGKVACVLASVAQVAERHPPGLGQPAELRVAGRQRAGAVGRARPRWATRSKGRKRRAPSAVARPAVRSRTSRARRRSAGRGGRSSSSFLHGGGQDGPAGEQVPQLGQVVVVARRARRASGRAKASPTIRSERRPLRSRTWRARRRDRGGRGRPGRRRCRPRSTPRWRSSGRPRA